MRTDRLRHSDEISAAGWLAPRLTRSFGSAVASVIPDGFEAYARILHPATAVTGELVGWGPVAQACGAVEHPLMQFHALVGTTWSTYQVKTPNWTGSAPQDGDLEPGSLAALLDLLADHTNDASRCWLCLWDGYGWSPGISQPPASRVALPGRNYLLYSGPLDAVPELGHWATREWFLPQSPNIFWPDDTSWCVATEIDLCCTYVGGDRDLIDALLVDPRLEVWEADPDDPISFDSDELNRR